MTSTPAVTGTATTTTTSSTTRTPKQSMDSQMFMNLLVAQLKYQDPSKPMDSAAMVQQTTQLASMETLTKLTTSSDSNLALNQHIAAAGMVGKNVSYADASGATVSGVASSVSFTGTVPMVNVGGTSVALSAITAISS